MDQPLFGPECCRIAKCVALSRIGDTRCVVHRRVLDIQKEKQERRERASTTKKGKKRERQF